MTYEHFEWNGKMFVIDKFLANALSSIVYNLPKDWDFVENVTGNRQTRSGKSVLAFTVAAYQAYLLKLLKLNDNAFNENNIFFDSKEMMEKAQLMPKYSVVVYDEGREGLAAQKAMTGVQQTLVDFFTECGQLNLIFIIVLPDFFDLRELIAVGRSECLINVFRKEVPIRVDFGDGVSKDIVRIDRGYFHFFNKASKDLLFDIFRTTRQKNYRAVKPTFPVGQFENQYPVDETVYRQLKKEALERFKTREERKEQEKMEKKLERKYQMTDIDIEKQLELVRKKEEIKEKIRQERLRVKFELRKSEMIKPEKQDKETVTAEEYERLYKKYEEEKKKAEFLKHWKGVEEQ